MLTRCIKLFHFKELWREKYRASLISPHFGHDCAGIKTFSHAHRQRRSRETVKRRCRHHRTGLSLCRRPLHRSFSCQTAETTRRSRGMASLPGMARQRIRHSSRHTIQQAVACSHAGDGQRRSPLLRCPCWFSVLSPASTGYPENRQKGPLALLQPQPSPRTGSAGASFPLQPANASGPSLRSRQRQSHRRRAGRCPRCDRPRRPRHLPPVLPPHPPRTSTPRAPAPR